MRMTGGEALKFPRNSLSGVAGFVSRGFSWHWRFRSVRRTVCRIMLWAARELLPISSKATARVVAVVVVQAEGVVVEAKPPFISLTYLPSSVRALRIESTNTHTYTHTCSFFSFWVCRAVRSYSQPLPSEYVHQLHLSYTLSYARAA